MRPVRMRNFFSVEATGRIVIAHYRASSMTCIPTFPFEVPDVIAPRERFVVSVAAVDNREKLLYPICVYFLPLVVISVLNFRILSILNRERINAEGRNLGKEKRSIRLLTAVVILFFFCHTGGLVIRFFADDEEYSEQFVLAKDVVNLLFNINSLANPLVRFFCVLLHTSLISSLYV
ncbi:unnamed protein product [Toxocara canis]|uniref:G_PROTEIN_RECEP_F1_2 domain-containing protein n=1 Tax=Toxocara canis TaxID=6265 RepID=A0A183V400_TOXCA|nr:unnamed protein product [Toxocara canis]